MAAVPTGQENEFHVKPENPEVRGAAQRRRDMREETGGPHPLSRRQFLVGLAGVAVGLSLDPYKFVTTERRLYRNTRIGLSLLLPEGWEFGSIADFAALRDQQQLLDEIPDEQHPLKNPENLPLFVFEDPRPARGELNPGIGMYDEEIPWETPADEEAEMAEHMLMFERFALSFRHVRVIDPPIRVPVRGARGTTARWSYTHDLEGASHPILIRDLLVFRGDRCHTFFMSDSVISPTVPSGVWRDFINSIRYSPPPG